MKLVREKRGRPAVVGAATAAAADTVGAGKAAASEEATDQFANNGSGRVIWAGLDSNQRRRKASRFTVCPVWPLRYLPSFVRAIHIGSHHVACNWPRPQSRVVISNDEIRMPNDQSNDEARMTKVHARVVISGFVI